jgi:kynurenine formamidase
VRYSELLQRKDAPPGSSWGLFGASDELGTINLLTPERILSAIASVRRGAVFNLDYPINTFTSIIRGARKPVRHTIFQRHPEHRDDWLDEFYLQQTSQIDGLRHRRHAVHGFYNRAMDNEVAVGTPRLGINRWAEHGIVGRGVLIDLDRYRRHLGKPLDHRGGEAFSTELIDEAAAAQGVQFHPGDILLLRTGWAEFVLDGLDDDQRQAFGAKFSCAGLIQSSQSLEWLWDHQFAMVAADNVAVESTPPVASSPFGREHDNGLMHQEMIAMLGLALGELWMLRDLATDCSRDHSYECLVLCKPLNLIGGVGSPANALAIK